jgi:hypothetical protein
MSKRLAPNKKAVESEILPPREHVGLYSPPSKNMPWLVVRVQGARLVEALAFDTEAQAADVAAQKAAEMSARDLNRRKRERS